MKLVGPPNMEDRECIEAVVLCYDVAMLRCYDVIDVIDVDIIAH